MGMHASGLDHSTVCHRGGTYWTNRSLYQHGRETIQLRWSHYCHRQWYIGLYFHYLPAPSRHDVRRFMARSFAVFLQRKRAASLFSIFASEWTGILPVSPSRYDLLGSTDIFSRVTVGGNILTMGMILAPASLPPVFHAMFTVPNMAINNSMACRVYRDIKFGRISSTATTVGTLPTLAVEPRLPGGASRRKHNNFDTFELQTSPGTTKFNESRFKESGVHITKSVEQISGDSMKIGVLWRLAQRGCNIYMFIYLHGLGSLEKLWLSLPCWWCAISLWERYLNSRFTSPPLIWVTLIRNAIYAKRKNEAFLAIYISNA